MGRLVVFSDSLEFKTKIDQTLREFCTEPVAYFSEVNGIEKYLKKSNDLTVVLVDGPKERNAFSQIDMAIKPFISKDHHLIIISNFPSFNEMAELFSQTMIEASFNKIKNILTKYSENLKFSPIPITSLMKLTFTPVELFLQLSSERFVKIIHSSTQIDHDVISSLVKKGVTSIHVEKKNLKDFTLFLMEQAYIALGKDNQASNRSIMSDALVSTTELVHKFGFSTKVLTVCNTVMDKIQNEICKQQDALGNYLQRLKDNDQLSNRFKFIELSSLIATQILNNTEEEINSIKIKKLIFASYFCDMALDKDSYTHIRNTEHLQTLDVKDQKIINNHAIKAAEIISNSEYAPLDVDVMIRQHHGSFLGFGLPKEISPKILPLSKCLMSAQEITHRVLLEPQRDIMELLNSISKEHQETPLSPYFEAFKRNFKRLN